MIDTVGLFRDPKLTLHVGRFALHQGYLLVREPLDGLRLIGVSELSLGRRSDQRPGIADRVFIHRGHQFHGFDLPKRSKLLEFPNAVDRDVLVLEYFGSFRANSIKEISFSFDASDIYVQGFGDALLGDTALDRL